MRMIKRSLRTSPGRGGFPGFPRAVPSELIAGIFPRRVLGSLTMAQTNP
jgi:hypothetical protein